MALASIETAKRGALAIANKTREALGLPAVDHLYVGQPGEANACPITNTIIDDDLDLNRYRVETRGRVMVYDTQGGLFSAVVSLPHRGGSMTFVRRFDRKEMPELIGTPERHQ
jgi:hypothetical protein